MRFLAFLQRLMSGVESARHSYKYWPLNAQGLQQPSYLLRGCETKNFYRVIALSIMMSFCSLFFPLPTSILTFEGVLTQGMTLIAWQAHSSRKGGV